METELKLLLSPADAQALRQHPLLARHAQAAPRTKDQTGVYFDTPELDLRHHDAGLRVRRSGDESIQTLKAGGGVQGGLHQRLEWESPVPGEQPDLALLRQLMPDDTELAGQILTPDIAGRLTAIFATRIQRTLWDLTLDDGSTVEFVLDQGNVEHAQRQVPICEIELELKQGDPLALFDFALALLRDIPLRIGVQSKAQRGYALYHAQLRQQRGEPAPSDASKARPLHLSRKMGLEQAFAAIVGNCLEQVLANDIADGDPQDIERLHQMRVGVRRLRSGLRLFEEVIALPPALAAEIEWLSESIGAARDWDVLADSTLASLPTPERSDAIDIAALQAAARKRARALHASAAQAVASPRMTALVLQLSRWLLASQWRSAMSPDQHQALERPLVDFVHQRLHHDARRLQKRARKMADDARARHRARIAAKKLRYDTEFFHAVLDARDSKPFLKALSHLQDQLGAMNDIAVAQRLLQELRRSHPALASGVAFARGHLAAQATHGQARGRKPWKKWKALVLPRVVTAT
ncbi:CYTH and CHAD domain-containing protein [Herbaspirillum sp. YR522]|uniref:CYTH and CHAD domain-containing protein n=1 Tax=Herbaspirillum sp. YR522 TaxID=1144342 RepID=UPI00026F998C|nr:CYTH and CHAD domain-containing protein [Herbaspirillum sp. YR522]EJN09003.1 hypothetical protein PMI40_00988 [Herbaspirillum sp. YR522]